MKITKSEKQSRVFDMMDERDFLAAKLVDAISRGHTYKARQLEDEIESYDQMIIELNAEIAA